MTTVVGNGEAAVSVLVKVKERATGRTATFLGAHFLRFRNGKITNYCAIIDSLDAALQLADD
jgi:ketosteroid isomerase-like protein